MALTATGTRPTVDAGAVTDMAGLRDLQAQAAAQSPQALRAAAQQFEALFLNMMLDSMRSATIDGGMGDSSETQLYQQLFDRQVASNIASTRGLGIADMLVRQLSASLPAQPDGAGTKAPGGLAAAAQAANPSAQAASTASAAATPSQFVRDILPLARRAGAELGVDPMALVAQAALESGWGGRLPRAADGRSSLNLFGIKADGGWQGRTVSAQTLEIQDGLPVPRRDAFRAYDNLAQSFADYVRLIKTSPRYAAARAAGADPAGYADALQQAGYATDPAYADKIRAILGSTPMAEARQWLAAQPRGTDT